MKKSLLIVGTLFLFASCGQLKEKYGRMACKCFEEIVEMTENSENHSDSEMNEAEERAIKCIEATNNQFKDLISENDAKEAVKETCPDTHKFLFPNE
jgi:hypothetical protein